MGRVTPRVSVVVPSCNELFLDKTILSLLDSATGDVEVIAVIDGPGERCPRVGDPRVTYFQHLEKMGMRSAINSGVARARGEFLMKSDGHCLFAEGWDEVLANACAEDWVMVPRRKRLDGETWGIQEVGKPDIDYHYLSYPNCQDDFGGPGLHARPWKERNADLSLRSIIIDDLMSFQGSCWFMPRSYFHRLELMEADNYGGFLNEPQEIGLKCWLSGGRMVVNKATWYAHLHKGKRWGRGYNMQESELRFGQRFTKRWLIGEAWSGINRPFEWLIEKFWPVPEWPDDRALWTRVPGYNA